MQRILSARSLRLSEGKRQGYRKTRERGGNAGDSISGVRNYNRVPHPPGGPQKDAGCVHGVLPESPATSVTRLRDTIRPVCGYTPIENILLCTYKSHTYSQQALNISRSAPSLTNSLSMQSTASIPLCAVTHRWSCSCSSSRPSTKVSV